MPKEPNYPVDAAKSFYNNFNFFCPFFDVTDFEFCLYVSVKMSPFHILSSYLIKLSCLLCWWVIMLVALSLKKVFKFE